jgi:hypothetical protein
MRLALRDGKPEYDQSGRVRVDCGDYEDWVLPEDCSEDVQMVLQRIGSPGQGVALPDPNERPTTSPAPVSSPSVSARELAAALNGTPAPGTRGRALSPEEIAARVRTENAKAAKAEAEAEVVRLRVERERTAMAEAERLRRRRQQEEEEPEIVLAPPADATPDLVEEERRTYQVEDLRLRAYRARVEREAIAEQLAAQRAQDAAGSQWAPVGWGCLTWIVCSALASALIRAVGTAGGSVVAPLVMVGAIVATVLVVRAVKAAQERTVAAVLQQEERRAECEQRQER